MPRTKKTEWSKGQSGDRMGDIVGFDPHCGWLRNPASPKGWLKHVETLYINSGIHYNDNIYIYIIYCHAYMLEVSLRDGLLHRKE